MKLMCKCGSIEELKTDHSLKDYELKNCNDGTFVLICRKCKDVVFIELNNSK